MFNHETKLSVLGIMAVAARTPTGKKDADGEAIMENKEIGKVNVPCPVLADFGITAELKKEEPTEEDGLPLYIDDVANWLQSAIWNQVKAQSRNKVVANKEGTAVLVKEGTKLAETFAELIAVGERTGEAMKARHDAKKSFVAFLEAQNKSAVVVKVLGDLFHNESAIVTAKDQFVDALGTHMKNWIPTLTEVDAGRFERKIGSIQEQFSSRNATMEDMK